MITTRIICRRRAFSALWLAPDRAKLTGRLQKTATTTRKTIDEYKIAAWSSLGAGATDCSGGAIGGRVIIILGREDGDEDKVVKTATSKPAGLMRDSDGRKRQECGFLVFGSGIGWFEPGAV